MNHEDFLNGIMNILKEPVMKPITDKFSCDDINEYFDVGASSMQGWRVMQEDAYNCILNFDENTSFFAVYDGNNGVEVALYCADKLPEFLKNLQEYKVGNFEKALAKAFLEFDKTLLDENVVRILENLAHGKFLERYGERIADYLINHNTENTEEVSSSDSAEIINDSKHSSKRENEDDEDENSDEQDDENDDDDKDFEEGKCSGCTAIIALLHGKDVYVANAGDSRCVLCRNGEAMDLSSDHKPENDIEKQRIQNAGGLVTPDNRLNADLNISRAIGLHKYKKNKNLPPEEQLISAMPDIDKFTITPEDEFMILASDGIWDSLSSDEVVEFVKNRIDEGRESISKICEELFDHCISLHETNSEKGDDNMAAVIIKFKQPKVLQLTSQLEQDKIAIKTHKNKKRQLESDSSNDSEPVAKRDKTDEDV